MNHTYLKGMLPILSLDFPVTITPLLLLCSKMYIFAYASCGELYCKLHVSASVNII